jgi:hypothetical protein
MFFSKGAHLVFASFCAGVCVGLARGMPVPARKMWHAGLLTFVEEGLYPHHCTYNDLCEGGWPNAHRAVQSSRSLRTKEEVDMMADLSPPDHNGPPSHGRASRQLG